MNTVKCYGRFLPSPKLDNDRKGERNFLKSEEILTRIYGEKISNLKIYNDILKKRIKKLTDGVSNLFIVLNNEKKDATMLTVGDGNTSSGILFYLINDLVHNNRSNCKLLITFSHFEIVKNRVNDKLKRCVLPQSNMIDVGSFLGCQNGDYDWVSSGNKLRKDAIPSSGCPLKAERDECQQKKERSPGGHSEKRERKNPCRMCPEWKENRLVNSDYLLNADTFVMGKKTEKYGRRHTKQRSTGEWDPSAVRKVYLSGQNIRHIFKMLCRSRRGKSVEGLNDEVTYEVVQFDVEMSDVRGLDVSSVRSYSSLGNESSICRKSSISTCSIIIIVVNNLKGADSSERVFLSHLCELFLKRREDTNRRRTPNLTFQKNHSLIIKYLFSLYKLPPLRGSATGVNCLPFELNFIYISSNFKKYRTASEFIYAYLKRLKRSEYFVQPNKKKEYLKSGFHKVDENIYVVKSLLNYYAELEIRGWEINRRVFNLRNYLTLLESSVIVGEKRRDHHTWTENRINNVLNLCRSSTSESGEQMQQVGTNNSCSLEKGNFFFLNKEVRIRRNDKEAERGKQHGGKYEDRGTSPRSTQMKDKAEDEVNHLRSVKSVREIKEGKHNPDKMHFKLNLYRRGKTNLVGSGDHPRIDTDYSSGNAILEKCNQHCYKRAGEKTNNVLPNSCKKKEETILVDPNSHRKCFPVEYGSSGAYTQCENDDSLKCRVKLFLPSGEDLRHSPQLDRINHGPFPRRSTPMQNFVPTNGMNLKRIHSSCMDPFGNTMEVEKLCDRNIVSHKGKEKKFLSCDILGMPHPNGSASSCEENENQLESVLQNIEQNRDFLKSISTLNSDIKKGKKKIDRRAKSLFEQVDQCLGGDTRSGKGRAGLEKRHDLGQYPELDGRDHPNGTIEGVRKNGEPQTGRQVGKHKKKKDYTCEEMEVKRGSNKLALQECAKSKLRRGKNNLSCSGKGNKSANSMDGHRKTEISNNSLTSPMSEGKGTNKFDDPISDPVDTLTHQSSLHTKKVDIKSKCGKFPVDGLSSKHIFDRATNKLPDKGKEKKTRNCVEHPVQLNGRKIDKKSVERIFSPTKRGDSNLALDANELDPLNKDSPWLGQNGGNIEKEIGMEENTPGIEEVLLYEEGINYNGDHILMCVGESQSGGLSSIAEIGALTHVSNSKGDDRGKNTIKKAQEEEESHVRPSNESVFSFSSENKNETSKDNHYCSSQTTDDEIISGCTLDGETIRAVSPNGKKKYAIRGSSGMAKVRKKRQNNSSDCVDNENVTVTSSGSQSTEARSNVSDSCEEELEQSITNYHSHFKKLLKSHMSLLQKKFVDDKNDLELLKKIKFAKGVLREYNKVLGRNWNDKHEQSVLLRQVISNGWGVGDAMCEQHCGSSCRDRYSKRVDMCKNCKDGFLRGRNKTTDGELVHKGVHPGRDAESADAVICLTGGQMDLSPPYGDVSEVEHTEGYSVERSTAPYRTGKSVDTDKRPPPSGNPKESNYGNSDYIDNFDGAEMEDSYTPEGEYVQWGEPQLPVSTNREENVSGENDKNVNASTHYYEENVPTDDPPHKGNVMTCDPNDIYNEYEEEPSGKEEKSALHVDHLDELQSGGRATSQGNYPSESYDWENPPPTNGDNDKKRYSGSRETDRIGHVMGRDMHKSDMVGNLHRGELFSQKSFSSKWDEVENVVVEDNSPDCTGEKTTLRRHAVIHKIRRKKKALKRGIQDEVNKLSKLSSKKKKLMSFILRAIERGEKDEELIAIVRSAIFKVEYFEQKKISKLKRMEKEFQKLTHVEEKIASNFFMRKSQSSGEMHNRTARRKSGHVGKNDNRVYQKCGSHLDEKKNKDAHRDEDKRNDKNVENHFQKKSQKDHQTGGVHPLRGGEKKEKKNNCAHVDAFQKGRVCNNFYNLNGHNRESKKSIAFSDLCVNLKKEKDTPRGHHNGGSSGTGGNKCRTRFTPAEDAKKCDAFFQNCGDTADCWSELSGNKLDGGQQHIGHFPQWDRDSSKETDKNKDRNITVAYRDRSKVRGSTRSSSHTFKKKVKGKRRTKLGHSYDRSLEGQNRVHLKRNPEKECTTERAENLRLGSSCFSNGGRSRREGISPSIGSDDKSTRRFQVGVKVPLTGGSMPTQERHRSNRIEKKSLRGNPNNFHVSVRMDPTRGNHLQRKGSFRRGHANRGFFPSENPPSSHTPFFYAQREGRYQELIPHSPSLHRQHVVSPNWDETKRTGGSSLPRCQAKGKAKTKRCEEEEEEVDEELDDEEQTKRNRNQRNFINVKHKSTPETEESKNMEKISIKTVINRHREKTIPCINYDTDRYRFKLGWWNWGKQSKLLENIEKCKENIKEKYYQNRKECKHRSSTNWTSKYFTKFQPNEYLYIPVTNKNYFRSKNSLKIRSNPVSDFHKVNLKPITGFLQSYEKEKQRQRKVPQAVIRVSTVPYVVDDYNVKRAVPKVGGKTGVSLGEANILLSDDEESNLNDTSGFFAKVSKKSAPRGYFPNGRGSYSSETNSNDEENSKGIIFKCRTKQAHKGENRNSNNGRAHEKRSSKTRLYNIGDDINGGRTHACRKGKAHSGDEGSNGKDGLGQRWDPKKKTTVKVRQYRIRSIESLSSVHSGPGRNPQGCSASMVPLSFGSPASGSAESSEVVGPTNAKYRVNLKSKKRADYPQGEDPRNTPSSKCSNKSEVQNSSRRSGSSCYSTSSLGTQNEEFQKDAKRDPHMCTPQRKKLTNDEEKNLSGRSYKNISMSSKREYPGYANNNDTHYNKYREGYTSMESELGRNRHRIEWDGSERRDSSSGSIGKVSEEGPCRRQYRPNEINEVDYIQPDRYDRERRKNKNKQTCKNSNHNYYPPTNDGYYEGQHRDSINPQTRGRKGHDADSLEKQYDEYFYDN
ncbi:Uncharacterized protein PCOAH_00027450 [Plasmodium coatneyi]|uniref:Uncharacterized protein n=1 Tax=Plasmodium coatneyi TaxID=208452 RepID=A0A1B1E0D1_9APIC|nr:Uncharacterized protein PCOAH_00027450 [Plasmodium coatneyi]ANQ08307.1 Uncharacterized protein PCOAH_00027450 [Plasmodium coatneyi]